MRSSICACRSALSDPWFWFHWHHSDSPLCILCDCHGCLHLMNFLTALLEGRLMSIIDFLCINSVLKSSPVQSFCPNFRQLSTELVATGCNQSFKRTLLKDQLQLVFGIHWLIICHERCIRWSIYGVDVLY